MQEIRFHGRGGQGAVTSAELLAQAAIAEGKHARAFPSFGPERRGAPVTAFCRINDGPIFLRSVIGKPDIVVVLDPSLFRVVNVTAGLRDDGILIVNSSNDPSYFTSGRLQKVATIDATRIALDVLKRPLTNTILLGSLLRVADIVSMDSLISSIKHRFGDKAFRLNMQVLEMAYKETVILPEWIQEEEKKIAGNDKPFH